MVSNARNDRDRAAAEGEGLTDEHDGLGAGAIHFV
jgi:hypothetical protein